MSRRARGAHKTPAERLVAARRRLVIGVAGFRAAERMAESYGRRMAALKRHRFAGMDPDRLVVPFRDQYLERCGWAGRLAGMREDAGRAGVGRREIERIVKGEL